MVNAAGELCAQINGLDLIFNKVIFNSFFLTFCLSLLNISIAFKINIQLIFLPIHCMKTNHLKTIKILIFQMTRYLLMEY